MENEFYAFLQNGTWELVALPIGKTSIECKWGFHVKLKADQTQDKYKAHLVAKGFLQVVKPTTIWVYLP